MHFLVSLRPRESRSYKTLSLEHHTSHHTNHTSHICIRICKFSKILKIIISVQKLTLTQNWLLQFGVQFFIGSLQRHLAAIFAGDRCRSRPVEKIFKKNQVFFSILLVRPLLQPQLDLCARLMKEFSMSGPPFSEACEAWGLHSTTLRLAQLF